MNDQRIVALIQEGKSDTALNALYKNYPQVRKLIRSKGGDTAAAEDIFQEALIILIRKIRETDFQLNAQLNTYLFSVCRYLWKDELKKRQRQITHNPEDALFNGEETAWLQRIEEESHFRLAEKILTQLKDRCQELLLLFYKGSVSLRDIAARMGYSSENTAKNQKYKCLEAAKNKLKELQHTFQTI